MTKGRLVLTMREGDKIQIGSDIIVTVGEKVGGSRFRLHCEAPLDINLKRVPLNENIRSNPQVILRKKT